MSFFDDISEEGFESTGDVLGGGGALESDVYDAVIKLAYAGTSSGGAKSVTILLDINGSEQRFTEYVTSGTAKGGKNTYEKNGKTFALPGFQQITDLLMITTGKGLRDQTLETKEVKQYDSEQKKEVPKPAPVFMELLGKPIKVALSKSIEDKTREVTKGVYEPTGETYEKSNLSKFFHPVKEITLQEAIDKVTEPTFIKLWLDKHKGKVRNNSKADKDVKSRPAGSSASGGGSPAKSLFD